MTQWITRFRPLQGGGLMRFNNQILINNKPLANKKNSFYVGEYGTKCIKKC